MSRPPTDREIARDRSAEAVARAFLRRIPTGNVHHHTSPAGEPWRETICTRCVRELAALLTTQTRTRDAAWRRAVRTVRGRKLSNDLFTAGWISACDNMLAAAPGARGTKGGRRG